MKTLIIKKNWMLFISLNMGLLNCLQAQNNSPSLATWTVGGNQFTGNLSIQKVGSITCDKVRIIANNTDMMTCTPDCNGSGGKKITLGSGTVINDTTGVTLMGIGNLNPANALSVQSSPASNTAVVYALSNTNTATTYAIQGRATATQGYGYAVFGEGGARGVYGKGSGGTFTGAVFGTYGLANGSGNSGTRYGAYGTSSNGVTNYGVYGLATGGTNAYGVYGRAISAANNFAGYFSGNVTVTGVFSNPSDLRFKENIQPYSGAVNKLMQVEVKTYDFKDEYAFMNLPKKNQVGVIAQDFEKIFPNLITNNVHPGEIDAETGAKISDELQYKGVNYLGLIPVLVQATKEQQSQIEDLKKVKDENTELKSEINLLKNQIREIQNKISGNSDRNSGDNAVLPESNQKAFLEQNTPNPFSEKTIINYFIPANSRLAQINIYSSSNNLLKSVDIIERGKNKLELSSGTFASGNYIYELVVDGTKADCKQMIFTK